MKKNLSQKDNKSSAFPIITLLFTIAVMAVTCAAVLYKYSVDKDHRRRWKDYDDCGLA